MNYRVLLFTFQQFGPILDVEIIFNERGSKVRNIPLYRTYLYTVEINDIHSKAYRANYVAIKKEKLKCILF